MTNFNHVGLRVSQAASAEDLRPFAGEMKVVPPSADAAEAAPHVAVLDLALEERSASAFLLDDEDVLEIN